MTRTHTPLTLAPITLGANIMNRTSTILARDDLDINIAAFNHHLDAEGKAEKTIQLYTSAARDLARFLRANGMPLTVLNIRREHVESYLISLRPRLSPATRNQNFRCLQAFWKYLMDEDEVKDSPLRNIARPTIPETPPDRVTIDQMRALLAVCDGKTFPDRRDSAIFLLFYSSGIRLAELTGLKLADVDHDRKQIRVTGKFHRTRDVRYGRLASRAIDRYLRARNLQPFADNPAFWLGERGPLTVWGVSQMIQRRAKQANLDNIHAHAFRHGFAIGYLGKGGQEGELMQLAGWKSRSMVERYAGQTAAERAQRSYDRYDPGEDL